MTEPHQPPYIKDADVWRPCPEHGVMVRMPGKCLVEGCTWELGDERVGRVLVSTNKPEEHA